VTRPRGTHREVAVPVATVWSSEHAPRDVDAAAVLPLPDVAGWTGGMDAVLRRGLHGRTETQALLGEPVTVLEDDGAWSRVTCGWQGYRSTDDGYPGWVRSEHLAEPVGRSAGALATVVARSTGCELDDGSTLEVSFASRLWVDGVGTDDVRVLLPGGRRGRLPREGVRLADADDAATYDGEALLATAREFLDLRYLWGGTCAWGLDCSGLVTVVLRAHGLLPPRDASDQAEWDGLAPVDLDDVRPGDLYFFARPGQRIYHVGFVSRPVGEDGVRWMLHAPEGGELIEDAPLAPHRRDTLVSAARVVAA
jgi:cell wall-associated NlpC family hydrolase